MNNRNLSLSMLMATLAACSSTPDRNQALEKARAQFNTAQNNPQVSELALDELRQAGKSLGEAEKAWNDGSKAVIVDHLAYLTVQRVTIAQETAASRNAQATTLSAAAERDKLLLSVRTHEVDAARQELAVAQQSDANKTTELAAADAAALSDKRQLATRTSEADLAWQQLALAQESNALKTRELATANAAALIDQARLESRDSRMIDLEIELQELNAKKTERGIIVTLGDVLFDSSQARLLPESEHSMQKLAAFFKRYPHHKASIDGYTDSTGEASANYTLSQHRADAVMTELVNLGVPADRLSKKAFGEEQPVADNSTLVGRQLNRRVEIVFAPPNP